MLNKGIQHVLWVCLLNFIKIYSPDKSQGYKLLLYYVLTTQLLEEQSLLED